MSEWKVSQGQATKQIKILELKNTMTELKTSVESIFSRLDKTEERISEFKYRLFEII